jgi:Ca2+-binding RTX toxin-like protein
LAFTTIPGASATDATSFIGTEGSDILNSFATITGFVEGLALGDTINLKTSSLAGSNSLSDWTVRAGDGSDTINIEADIVGGLFNGNQAGDVITISASLFGGARVLGGKNNDTVTVNGSVISSSVNGNREQDTVAVLGDLISGSVFGGQGSDNITVGDTTADDIDSSLISGDLGNDTITVTASLFSASTIDGGDGDDLIDASAVIKTAGLTDGLTINAGIGNDTVLAGATDDTIFGDDGNDIIAGGGGDDTVEGGGGDDNLVVGGNYLTIGGAGDGIDVVTGGAGVDRFWGKSVNGGTIDAPTWDKITDYVKGTDQLVDGNGNLVSYESYTGGTFATVSELLKATLIEGNLNVAVGGAAFGGFSSFIVSTDVAGKVLTIAQLNTDYEYATVTSASTVVGVV